MSSLVLDKSIYPFEHNYVHVNDLRYHYVDEGSGNPVIMVHGNPSWSIYYRNLVNALKDTHRCIAPDHIGCGFSDKPSDNEYKYHLESRINDLENFILKLKLDKPITLVVHDWGGYIGMGFATRHPDKVERIVILNTGAFHLPEGKKVPAILRLCRDTSFGTLLIRGFNLFAVITSIIGCKRKIMPSEIRKAYCSPYNSWKNRIATSRFVQDIPMVPEDPSYNTLTQIEQNLHKLENKKILICWGEKDFVFDKHFLNKWIKIFPKPEVKRFSDCGHYVLEDAGSEIVDYIKDFLERNPI
ncbi:MAG: alpha/beta fold hydrolase [Candidatus Sericytochromatia bacterium]